MDVVGAQSNVVVPLEERVCRRCSGNVLDDAHHIVFGCISMGSICWNHPGLFINGPRSRSLDVFVYGTKSGGGGRFCVRVQEGMLNCVFSVRLGLQISQTLEIHFA